jgi:peptidyl-tRNA hydrolase
MIFCKELNKSFEDKEQMFKEISLNETLIIDAKKTEIKSIDKGLQIVTNQNEIEKALNNQIEKGLKFDADYYYFVVNSANILDSHNDMHVDGNWEKSKKEMQGKVYLVLEHKLEIENVIAMPKDIELLTAKVPFSLLGKPYDGETYSFIYKVAKDKIVHPKIDEFLKNGYNLQASVRMQYVKIEFAFNSNNPDYAKYKANFDTYYPLMENKDEFKNIEYFNIIKEAKNIKESSLVLFGSNDTTGRIDNKTEPVQTTQEIEIKEEPVIETTQKQKRVLIF